jgi:hypothetical protein
MARYQVKIKKLSLSALMIEPRLVMWVKKGIRMQAGHWLPLTDYASKYRISVSTLRRRIKGGQIEFRFDDGKYWIMDFGAEESQVSVPMSPTFADIKEQVPVASDEPIISSASRLLNELKRAYMSILQEKEEQIIQLKEEVSDLKTLVRVLEDDNDRMRKHLSQF